jgi:hypothetical protein
MTCGRMCLATNPKALQKARIKKPPFGGFFNLAEKEDDFALRAIVAPRRCSLAFGSGRPL